MADPFVDRDRMAKIREAYCRRDAMRLVWQWVKDGTIEFREFTPLVNLVNFFHPG